MNRLFVKLLLRVEKLYQGSERSAGALCTELGAGVPPLWATVGTPMWARVHRPQRALGPLLRGPAVVRPRWHP